MEGVEAGIEAGTEVVVGTGGAEEVGDGEEARGGRGVCGLTGGIRQMSVWIWI